MLKNSIEVAGVLSLSALPILIVFGIVGSVIAALRAVSRGSQNEITKR